MTILDILLLMMLLYLYAESKMLLFVLVGFNKCSNQMLLHYKSKQMTPARHYCLPPPLSSSQNVRISL